MVVVMTTLQLSAQEDLVEKFLDVAARGEVRQVSTLLSLSPSLLNQTRTNGWTALMLAARNGHYHVVETLLSHGCDKFSVNRSSQTAYDIAKFWGHRHISNLLAQTDGQCQHLLPASDATQLENYFSRETLDRLSEKRTDSAWLEDRKSNPDTVFLLFSNTSPMLSTMKEGGHISGQQAEAKLCRFGYELVRDLLQRPGSLLVFLGVEKSKRPCSSSSCLTEEKIRDPPAWFAISTDEEPAELLRLSGTTKSFFPQRANRDLLTLPEDEAGIVAQARAVLAWHSRYSFCPTCGTSTKPEEGGHKRICLNAKCSSLQGVHNTCYPRVDPVVIMLVIHPDGNQCLLGRKKIFPVRMFSCLAGFIEPGETIEEAVRREVQEESGVKVGPVRYVFSQPWPMPSNLMIGCLAVAMSTEITVDEDEIEEAHWFTRQQVIDSLFREANPALTIPPRQTIAHQLIRHWISMTSNL